MPRSIFVVIFCCTLLVLALTSGMANAQTGKIVSVNQDCDNQQGQGDQEGTTVTARAAATALPALPTPTLPPAPVVQPVQPVVVTPQGVTTNNYYTTRVVNRTIRAKSGGGGHHCTQNDGCKVYVTTPPPAPAAPPTPAAPPVNVNCGRDEEECGGGGYRHRAPIDPLVVGALWTFFILLLVGGFILGLKYLASDAARKEKQEENRGAAIAAARAKAKGKQKTRRTKVKTIGAALKTTTEKYIPGAARKVKVGADIGGDSFTAESDETNPATPATEGSKFDQFLAKLAKGGERNIDFELNAQELAKELAPALAPALASELKNQK